jgi:hypothetical protein
MTTSDLRVFFYGSFINRDVLARGGFRVERTEVAKLWGFDIRVHTLATLVRSDGRCVYGIVCPASHEALQRLYAQDWLHAAYHPYPVVVDTGDGQLIPALCYIAESDPPERPADDYLSWIVSAAQDLGFPQWYVDRIVRAGSAAAESSA